MDMLVGMNKGKKHKKDAWDWNAGPHPDNVATTKKGVEYDLERMTAESVTEKQLLGTRAIKGKDWETWGRDESARLNHNNLETE